jgi:glycosyltransferase involved in cell wall biosynthesis
MTAFADRKPAFGQKAKEDIASASSRDSCWALIGNKKSRYDCDYEPPLVSLIVTAYNYEKYILQCLRSVLNQTYSHFECIIVDDRSIDETQKVAQAAITAWNDPRFTLITPSKNLGQLGAQGFGLAYAKGQFIVFLDADDLLHTNFIERHLYAHLNLPTPVGFTSSDQWHINAEGAVLSFHHPDIFDGHVSNKGSYFVIRSDELDDRGIDCRLLPKHGLKERFDPWWWGTQSTMMFRRDLLDMMLPDPFDARHYRICADFYLVRFGHFFTASALLYESLSSYRRHGQNNFCSNPLTANVPVGDMRDHPKMETFYSLALQILQDRSEAYVGMLGEERYNAFRSNFRHRLNRLTISTALLDIINRFGSRRSSLHPRSAQPDKAKRP